jgi:hypothetical protein
MRDRNPVALRKAIKHLTDKQKESLEIEKDTQEFLARGGKITVADITQRAKDNWAFGNGNVKRG